MHTLRHSYLFSNKPCFCRAESAAEYWVIDNCISTSLHCCLFPNAVQLQLTWRTAVQSNHEHWPGHGLSAICSQPLSHVVFLLSLKALLPAQFLHDSLTKHLHSIAIYLSNSLYSELRSRWTLCCVDVCNDYHVFLTEIMISVSILHCLHPWVIQTVIQTLLPVPLIINSKLPSALTIKIKSVCPTIPHYIYSWHSPSPAFIHHPLTFAAPIYSLQWIKYMSSKQPFLDWKVFYTHSVHIITEIKESGTY